ncbi:unnamed protein product, partial [Mesorhabditis belari]|uniref:Uncharacterized protein n=1 Tax=Mesorhabditis belari TaxID=2138241 RepID=A0AAF3F4N6_9BILA
MPSEENQKRKESGKPAKRTTVLEISLDRSSQGNKNKLQMRLPKGAPLTLSLRIRKAFPVINRLAALPLGTWAVISVVTITGFGFFAVGIYPKLNHDYYAEAQTKERALLHATKEQLAQGQNVWRDPFEKK